MAASGPAPPPLAFDTFGEMLKYLRRRAHLTQKELSIAVGYSEAQISRLEQNQRLPDLASLAALFVPALDLGDDPRTAARLMELATRARGESATFTHTVTREIIETIEADAPAPAHNLPRQLTDLIGREAEVEAVARLLADSRLVTLTGAGGAGKTRLALEAAARAAAGYRDGVALVELAPLADPTHLAQAAASALRVKLGGDRPPLEGLLRSLRARRLLLVLDNCEHLILPAAHFAEAVLRGCPHVRVLTTSRETLRLAGETVYRVPPLAEPDAVQLFVARARQAQPAFALSDGNKPVIAQIGRRLDGLPLAIELAAARVSVMTVDEIAARLDDALNTLAEGSRTAPAANKRCARPSGGATNCSTTMSARCSGGWRCWLVGLRRRRWPRWRAGTAGGRGAPLKRLGRRTPVSPGLRLSHA